MSYVGQNIPHDSAAGHVTGASMFLDDLPPARGELVVGCLGSPFAHARVLSIDLEDARRVPGVVALLTHRDVPGANRFGPVVHDEELLAADVAMYVGHPIVLIAADSAEAVEAARHAIKLDVEELPPILSIDDAIAAGSFLSTTRKIERGDVDGIFAGAHHANGNGTGRLRTIEGELYIGGQEHFYLESQVAIVHPGEGRTFAVHSSTQHPSEVQTLVAEALGVPFNHVVVTCRRMGGGFGWSGTSSARRLRRVDSLSSSASVCRPSAA
jgi:xanthine dehydrogenase large subunit